MTVIPAQAGIQVVGKTKMEIKDVIYLVLGSNFIIALATFITTYLTTKMQMKNSDERFKIELGRAIDVENKKRKWEVRSSPLLKLREELAVMATKSDIIVNLSKKIHELTNIQEKEEAHKKLIANLNEWYKYVESGALKQATYFQYDEELFNKFMEIINLYSTTYNAINYKNEIPDKKIWPEVVKLQELINKKLEEL